MNLNIYHLYISLKIMNLPGGISRVGILNAPEWSINNSKRTTPKAAVEKPLFVGAFN